MGADPMHRIGGDLIIAVLLFLLLVLYSLPSFALQPVQAFVEGARLRNPDALEAQANLSQQRAQADAALGRVLPGVSARGAYTRNQFSSQIDLAAPGQPSQVVTIVPKDQWDGSATLNVPLIDLANFRRVGAQKTSAEGAARQLDSTRLQVEAQVVQDYYQVVANLALVAASRTALEVSREGLRLADARYRAGAAAILDVDRARADVEQQVQQVASAELQLALAARALESASEVKPDVSVAVQLTDDLRPEPEMGVCARRTRGRRPCGRASAGAIPRRHDHAARFAAGAARRLHRGGQPDPGRRGSGQRARAAALVVGPEPPRLKRKECPMNNLSRIAWP